MKADRELSALDLRERLAGLQTALTVVYADQASLGAPPGWMKQVYQAQYASAALPPTWVEIANARHFLMLDQPQAFVAALQRFVGAGA
jgi:pimeloyl-[acyl-carrier protein] methyl ester esterase